MKKLIKMFKGLPPEMRMMLMMAGVGSPIGAIYALQRWVFPRTSLIIIILCVAAVIAVLGLVGFLISKLFGRGSKKRSKKMASELAASAESGPVSMDVRAAIKENNEKLFNAIKDMHRLGISVYELPWYVVIGDSGCGKTRLINEGGLIFSTGKPEGYQLGTLNYNWWFTEDAVFIDMAGRLCNPKEDSDHREWDALMNTLKKGRKGFPINGTLVCVSADHLLADPVEKIQDDANTMLERLRDLQSKLGVTFATYLVVTKCDKILGFMEYFDRAEDDVRVRNQIVGWSKPGDFKELYDPENFEADFGEVYGRLNELRLRRLNDEADEIELGLACSFPEEFRGLLNPLRIYVSTLFPAIKKPRAIKNLIFRGIYYTTATQEGSLILKHLTERLGANAAEQFAPLDLYPRKKPLFIKDVFFRKIFPEQGLVFRNEGQVERNKKLAKLLNIGSGVLVVLLVGMFWWSISKFNSLIGDPRKHAQDSVKVEIAGQPPKALSHASLIGRDVRSLEDHPLPAKILSMWSGWRDPIEHLETVQLGLFERRVLPEALDDVNQALKAGIDRGSGDDNAAESYKSALAQYIVWYGCSQESSASSELTIDGFRALCGVVTNSESIIHAKDFWDQAAAYFAAVGSGGWDKNPARLLAEGELQPYETIRLAIGHVYRYFVRYAELDTAYSSETIQEWMRIQGRCATMSERYVQMLQMTDRDYNTVADVELLQSEFRNKFKEFDEAFEAAEWKLQDESFSTKIDPIRDAILAQRAEWVKYEQDLLAKYAICQTPPARDVRDLVNSIRQGGGPNRLTGLDEILWATLKRTRLTDEPYHDERNYEKERFYRFVREVYEAYGHIIELVRGDGADSDRTVRTQDVRQVHTVLGKIDDQMADKAGSSELSRQAMEGWNSNLEDYLEAMAEPPDESSFPEGFDQAGKWQRKGLKDLDEWHNDMIRRGNATRLLETIQDLLQDIGDWGLAEVAGGGASWCAKQSSSYRIDEIPGCGIVVERQQARKTPVKDKKDRSRGRRGTRRSRRRSKDRPTEARRFPTTEPSRGRTGIPNCATREFLNGVVLQWYDLQGLLSEFDSRNFLRAGEGDALNELCSRKVDEAGRRYFKSYVRSWTKAYAEKKFPSLEKLLKNPGSWNSFARRVGSRTNVDNELHEDLTTILAALPYWSAYQEEDGLWSLEDENDDYVIWMADAVVDEWGNLDNFVYNRELPSSYKEGDRFQNDPPVQIAEDFVKRWNALSEAISNNAAFRERWDRVAKNPRRASVNAAPIPWNKIQSLREETGLEEEKLTGQLIAFENLAKGLLSEELTDIVHRIQEKFFGDKKAQDGWPYLAGSNPDRVSLATVQFEKFKEFLGELHRAEDSFAVLEAGFEDELAEARSNFYARCGQWRRFLGLNENGGTEPLAFRVKGGDPTTDPAFRNRGVDDTAQLYYRTVELYLGDLKWTKDEGTGTETRGALRRSTEVEGYHSVFKTEWDWPQTEDREFEVSLTEGQNVGRGGDVYQTRSRNLGRSSPLAFCAYLQKDGVPSPDRREWKKLHTFKMDGGKTVGEMFVFKLDRLLPEPIKPLKRPGGRR